MGRSRSGTIFWSSLSVFPLSAVASPLSQCPIVPCGGLCGCEKQKVGVASKWRALLLVVQRDDDLAAFSSFDTPLDAVWRFNLLVCQTSCLPHGPKSP